MHALRCDWAFTEWNLAFPGVSPTIKTSGVSLLVFLGACFLPPCLPKVLDPGFLKVGSLSHFPVSLRLLEAAGMAYWARSGHYKTWTVDYGLDCGLDHGLGFSL